VTASGAVTKQGTGSMALSWKGLDESLFLSPLPFAVERGLVFIISMSYKRTAFFQLVVSQNIPEIVAFRLFSYCIFWQISNIFCSFETSSHRSQTPTIFWTYFLKVLRGERAKILA